MKRLAILCVVGAAIAGLGRAGAGERTIDLASPSATAPVVVPDGEDLEVALANVAPSAKYRWTFKGRGGALRQPVQPLFIPPAHGFDAYVPPAACADVKSDGQALIACVDEAQVGPRVKALEAKLARDACSADPAKLILAVPIRMTRVSLRQSQRLSPGEEVTLVVERLSPTGDTPVRTWTTTFRGGPPDVGWTYPDEQTWIVHDVAQDIAEMAEFARSRALRQQAEVSVSAAPATAGAAPGFRVATLAGGASVVVTLDPHAWAPTAYAPLARLLLRGAGAKAASAGAGDGASVVTRLTDLRAPVIEAANLRVSRRLTEQPTDSQAHEEAALVVGAMALREAAGEFADVRRLASRMTAHLALGRALRGEAGLGPDGRVAEVLLATLVERQADALASLARMSEQPGITQAESAWVNALAMRNDGDWRRLAEPAKATLLERIEYFRALAMADSASRALEGLAGRSLEPVPDWGRVVLRSFFSVEEGQMFARESIESELEELREVWRLHGSELSASQAAAALGTAPGRAVKVGPDGKASVEVLDGGFWAAAASRHVCADVVAVDDFLRRRLGVKDRADAFSKESTQAFGTLPLYAFSRVLSGEPDRGFCAAADGVIRKAPETLTASNWELAYNRCGRVPPNVPGYSSWFSPITPYGTALDAYNRLVVADISLRAGLPEVEKLRELAPFNGNVLLAYLGRKYRGQADAATIVQEFGPMAEYQVAGVRQVLKGYEANPAMYRQLLEKLCAFSADRCPDLGAHLAATGAADAAAIAYQRAFDHGLDRVAVSHHADWLVDYYQERGEPAKALEVATKAAETYSQAGLSAMARYQERLKNYDGALEYYKRIAERYEDEDSISAFYIRYQARVGGDRFAAEAAAATKRIFPDGMQKVALGDLRGGVVGIRVTEPGRVGQSWGLRANDVVVALDGYRVQTNGQYKVVKAMSDDPKMRLVVSQMGRYVEVTGERRHIMYFDPQPTMAPVAPVRETP